MRGDMSFIKQRVVAFVMVAGFAGACAVTAWPARADNWPAFRGADGQSVSTEKGFPIEWAPDKNVRWHVALPGRSNG